MILSTSGKTAQRNTKIVATLGPASGNHLQIKSLIDSGVNVFRMNFSHGTHESHLAMLEIVRHEADKAGKFIAVFQDLCGPKMRIGEVDDGAIQLVTGQVIHLRHFDGRIGSLNALYVEAFDPSHVMKPGEKALLADGRIELIAERVLGDSVVCQVSAGGILRSRSGISLPNSKLNLPCLTEKDLLDLTWGVKNNVDYVALSFVGGAQDIRELRRHISDLGGRCGVIAKVERAQALDNILEISETADAVMVARGDLGLELPLEKVPAAQRLIISTCNQHGTPVITATQMLVSMVKEVRPTRAEASDVYSAVRDGTDCVMLSEETAIGDHPSLVVEVLDRILVEAEKEIFGPCARTSTWGLELITVADSVCYAAASAAGRLLAAAIVCCTYSGSSARMLAKYRPTQPLFAVSSQMDTLRRIALYWGVKPVPLESYQNTDREQEIMSALVAVRDYCGIKPGSRIVVTTGRQAHQTGGTTLMEIREVPRL